MIQLRRPSGFTLVEIMIVIAIIGILAAIAIPNFIFYRSTAYNASAEEDAKNAYIVAGAYFSDYPSAALSTISQLTAYGFRQTEGVTITVSGVQDTLQISASHKSGTKTYTVNSKGQVDD